MRNQGKSNKYEVFSNLNGGLATRPTPLVIEAGSKKKMLSPALRNVDFFAKGGIDKRNGKTIQGSAISSTSYQSQTTEDLTISLTSVGGEYAIAQKITTGAAVSVASIAVKISADSATGTSTPTTCKIYTNSSGIPGALVTNGTSSIQTLNDSATPVLTTFTFPTPPSLSGATIYWFVFDFDGGPGDIGYMKGTTGASGNVKTDASYDSGSWASLSRDLYYVITSTATTNVIQGIYDFRFGSSSTQKQMAAMGGALYWNNSGTWTSLTTGLGSGQNNLWSFSALDDYLFTWDNGTNISRWWNGSASATSPHGYRPVGTFARSAGGGSIANGTYKLMMVTTLTSGGFRSSAEATVTTTGGGTDKIAASGVAIDDVAAQFGPDHAGNDTATKIFMTTAGGSIYYKLATGSVSVGNPIPDATPAFNVTAAPAGTENTLLDEYGVPQEYFTNQITTPTCKYSTVFNNFLVMAGDGTYPRRIWFSELGAPQIWAAPAVDSTSSPIYGTYLDIGDSDDNEPLVGVFAWGEYLYALKRHSVYIVAYTGNASAPFQVKNISRGLGCLSHWSCKALGSSRFVFISERGPVECYGTVVRLIPSSANILDRFDPNNSSRYNLAAMQYTTGGNNSTKMQVWWGVSSTSATTRDLTLVYDYENDSFWENDVSANYYAEVTDSNFFPSVWSGDYSAQIFKMDNGTTDNGSAIDFYFDTPWYQGSEANVWKQWDNLFIQGTVQNSGTLSVDVYLDFATSSSYSLTYDMTAAEFKGGSNRPLGDRSKAIKFRVRNSELSVPVHIDSIAIAYQDLGFSV
jgi:hypothetical protein